MKYAYFPGCSVHASDKEYGESCKAVSKILGIELIEIPDWNCCGAIDAIYSYRPLFSIALPARNLSLAEKMDLDIVTLCSACYHTLSRTNKLLHEEPKLVNKVKEILRSAGLTYIGKVKVRHYLDVLINDVGLDEIARHVKVPLSELKAAPYYGCLLVRPPNISNFDDPEHPQSMDKLIETLGASSVNYIDKTRCCGASLAITDEPVMMEMTKKLLMEAKDSGAQCLVTACPLCQFNLDVKQHDIESSYKLEINLPILYFTQLMGVSFGIKPNDLGLRKNCVSPMGLLQQLKVTR
ncbi:MAG: CoB--CoM heterodisulfide reductase iron-sulfur subunit B family protein [Candidatus Heimdallarchaeota archaeon]